MKIIIIVLVVLISGGLATLAQEPPKSPPKNGWRERLALREKQFVEVYDMVKRIEERLMGEKKEKNNEKEMVGWDFEGNRYWSDGTIDKFPMEPRRSNYR
jgi:hypothetical protein